MSRKLTDAEKKANAEKRETAKAKNAAKAAEKLNESLHKNNAVAGGGEGAGSDNPAAGSTDPAPNSGEDQPNAAVATGAGAGKDSDVDASPPAKSEPAPQKPVALTADTGPQVSIKTVRGVKSRWRTGLKFGPEPQTFKIDDLSKAECMALKADPSLVLEFSNGS